MTLAQLSYPVDDCIIGIHAEALCHREVIGPSSQKLFTGHPGFPNLPPHIIVDLDNAHSVSDKFQIIGLYFLTAKPADCIVRQGLTCGFFVLEPPKKLLPAFILT